jgi:hypothetical protein
MIARGWRHNQIEMTQFFINVIDMVNCSWLSLSRTLQLEVDCTALVDATKGFCST